MALDITSAGAVGYHSFKKVNVNYEDNFIYFKDRNIPATLGNGVSYIFDSPSPSIKGIANDSLVYVQKTTTYELRLRNSSNVDLDLLAGTEAGSITLNTPIVYESKLNLGLSTPSNQAVKYYTDDVPLTGLVSGNTYFLKNVTADFTGVQSLYDFTTHTFTTCGAQGRLGPTSAQIQSAYTTNWHTQYLKLGDFQGYQDWTVPVSGVYEFDIAGAAGFQGTVGTAGRGARIRGRIDLVKGETITVVVGQIGTAPETPNTTNGGSGGGTFVVRKNGNQPLFIAGGGSASVNSTTAPYGVGKDGQLSTSGGVGGALGENGGLDGAGGQSAGGNSGGGGGFKSRGTNGATGLSGGGSFLDGLVAADNGANLGGNGGFGGGASSDGVLGQSGGAGGYSGGSGAGVSTANRTGGGGGSFIASTATSVATSNGTFNGLTTFNGSAITNLNSWSTTNGSVAVTLIQSFTSVNTVHPTALDAQNGTNAIAVAPAGSSYHAFVPITYDIQNDAIHSSSPHGLANNQRISFDFQGSTPDISESFVYLVEKISDYTYKIKRNNATINLTVPPAESALDLLKPVVIDLEQSTITIPNHGFVVDQPVQYSAGSGTRISPLVSGATYYISEVIDVNTIKLKNAIDSPTNITFTAVGTGSDHSFLFLTVNFTENSLYIPNHGLVSGQKIRYNTGAGSAVGGLTNNQTYYILRVDASTIKLTTDPGLQTIVDLTSVGTGTHSLFIASIDFIDNRITIPNHGFLQGELVEYNSRGQTVINGLETNQTYYIIFVDGDNIKLASSPENADSGTAIDLLESPAGVGRHTLTSLSQTPDGIYEIKDIPTDDTFVVTARGQISEIVKDFNPRVVANLETNAFLFPGHGFVTGTKLTYDAGVDGIEISGLTDGQDYYTVVINQDYFRLATTLENANSGITIDITDFGTGIEHKFTSSQLSGKIVGAGTVTIAANSILVTGTGTSFSKLLKVGDPFTIYPPNTVVESTFASANVDIVNDQITVTGHGFVTGDIIKFSSNNGVAPAPLVNGYYYYIGRVDANTVKLYNTKANAIAATNVVALSSAGTGSNFKLSKVTPRGPIVRRILAIGSDTQITVDRSYSEAYTAIPYSYPTFIYVRPSGYSIHRPFDGGVEMSTGAGNSFGQIIRQTRKYFRYQSGKGIQTSFAINFKPSVDIQSMERFSPTTIECKTRRPHGLISGLFIKVAEAQDSNGDLSTVYNGEFQVTVVDLTTFRITSINEVPEGAEAKAYGFPQFHVTSWVNGALRSGMFDFQNGMFFEFDGQKLYAVRRSSTQQTAGTVSALRGSELIFGDKTKFTAQFDVGDNIVLRGQTYKVIDITSDTEMAIRPEYRGSTGLEISFDPTTDLNVSTDIFTIVRHGLSQNIPVIYNSIDGEPIGGLINGNTYYADVLDANRFKLMASPNSETNVSISSAGTTTVHSFVPAKSGLIVTKTIDTRIPQDEWNVDKCDGTGPTGYNLDLSKIQMCYMDYSWYGAGKIRFGFKGKDGQVIYVHEFKHNNQLFESYFRSGNLPARYEVVTFENPTYIPSLFHWGTSVIMDGRFDDDRGYLFTKRSQTLDIQGTTTKSFAGTGINLSNDLITVLSHGFRTGDLVQFQSIASDGLPGVNSQNPQTRIVGSNTYANLSNTDKYKILVNSDDKIHLVPENSKITIGGSTAQDGTTITVVTSSAHELQTNMYVGVYGSNFVVTGPRTVTVTNPTTFTYTVPAGPRVSVGISSTRLRSNVVSLTTSTPHGFSVGDRIRVTGTGSTVYQGTFTVKEVPSATTLTYDRTNNNIAFANDTGTVAILVNTIPTATITTGALASNVVTITTTVAHGFKVGDLVTIAGASNAVYNGTYEIASVTDTTFTYDKINANITSATIGGTATVTSATNSEAGLAVTEVIDFQTTGNVQYTFYLHPNGSLNNTTGPNYQPLISLRLSPSVDGGLTGKLGDKDIINRMQVRMQEVGISTDELVEVKLILNGRLNNLGFVPNEAPSLVEIVEHTPQDTISGGIQVYNFEAQGGTDGEARATTVDIGTLFELSNSILGGDNIFPDGPDILTVCVSRLTGNATRSSAKLSWGEAQA